jgi:hypothetical protein
MLLSPKISTSQFCLSTPSFVKDNNCHSILFEYDGQVNSEIVFKIENCRVRQKIYKDKFVVAHTSTIPGIIFDHCSNLFGSKFCGSEPKLLKLKVLQNFKEKGIVEGLDTEDIVDIGVKFSDCWEYEGKIYPSFKLVYVSKKEKSTKVKEDINKYKDMFE